MITVNWANYPSVQTHETGTNKIVFVQNRELDPKGGGIDKGVPRPRFALQGTSRGSYRCTPCYRCTPLPKKFRAFGAILLLCLLFSSVQFMFLTPKTIVLDLLYYFLSLWRSFPSEYASGYHRTAREKNSPQSKHCCHKTLANATYRKCLAPEFRLSLSCLKTFL